MQIEARSKDIKKSTLVRQALEYYLSQKGISQKQSLYSLSTDICGSIEGPEDLSQNAAHMEGYGEF